MTPGPDMRPFADDEVNAAWAEVNKARKEAERLRDDLVRAHRMLGLYICHAPADVSERVREDYAKQHGEAMSP